MSDDPKDPHCFIVGCPRSGTTLLSVILDRHSELAITPETAFYDEIAPKLMAGHVLKDVLASWTRLPELGLDAGDVIAVCGLQPTLAKVLKTLLALYAEARSKPRYGEKTPQHLNHVPAIIGDFPNSRIVCLVRDGRDVALSLSRMPWWQEGVRGAASLWLASVERSELFARQYPRQFMTARYEQMIERPKAVIGDIMDFLGLDFQSAQLGSAPSDVVLPRSNAWKGLALKPIDRTQAGRWRSINAVAEVEHLNKTLGPALKRLGYPV